MKTEIAVEWERRLRSGEYPQVTGYLRTQDGYCCLGVLSGMAEEAGVVQCIDSRYGGGAFWYEGDSRDGGLSVLPSEVVRWAGLKTGQDPRARDTSLGSMNDDGKPFSEIADVIHENRDAL